MDTLLLIHSFVRWIIILVAVIVIVKFAIGWAANSLFKADGSRALPLRSAV